MKRSIVLLCVCAVATGAANSNAMPSSGGATAVAVLKSEVTYLNARKWRPYYALMGPRFRARCDYSTFVARNTYVRSMISRASVKMISSRVSGSRAYLSYETFGPPLKPFVTKNDLFVRIGGRWYDEFDAVTTCG